jgi:hypothetical protein
MNYNIIYIMERYLYIFIISIFFLCMCLVCKGCMKIYDRFSVDDVSNHINISQNLKLTYDPSCDRVKPSPAPPPPTPAPTPPAPTPPAPTPPAPAPNIEDIPDENILIVNNTSDNLNIFIIISDKINSEKYLNSLQINTEKSTNNVKKSNIIDWNSSSINKLPWNPIGSESSIQIIIPENEWVTFNNPIPVPDGLGPFNDQMIIWPIKLKSEYSGQIIKTFDGKTNVPIQIFDQMPIKFEIGAKVISDSSAVDGINYKFKYELTSCDGNECTSNKIIYTEVSENPCDNINDKYKLEVGCYSPPKLDCGINKPEPVNQSTIYCNPDTQSCAINECTKLFYNIPADLLEYTYPNVDNGEKNPNNVNNYGPVKYYFGIQGLEQGHLNDTNGLQLKNYCDKVQGTGDFTTYCFDYNDGSSSKNLIDPYKIKLTFSDL